MLHQKYTHISSVFNSCLEKAKFPVTCTENKVSLLKIYFFNFYIFSNTDVLSIRSANIFNFVILSLNWCGRKESTWEKLITSCRMACWWGWWQCLPWVQGSGFDSVAISTSKKLGTLSAKGALDLQRFGIEEEVFSFTVDSFQPKLQPAFTSTQQQSCQSTVKYRHE